MVAASSRGLAPERTATSRALQGIVARMPALRNAARRASRVAEEADDLLQDALLELVRAGRHDLENPENLAWLHGVLKNLGAMTARSAVRRRIRDDLWSGQHSLEELPTWWSAQDRELETILEALPLSLRRVAQLALSGHDRQEIAWLLGLRDEALRQRISALRRRLSDLDRDVVGFALDAGRVAPNDGCATPRWTVDLLRRALLPVARLSRGAGVSDPDGHLMVLSAPGPGKIPNIPPHIQELPGNK
jgi:DNA-directed RNA polymerase specialized sigma24 family protein